MSEIKSECEGQDKCDDCQKDCEKPEEVVLVHPRRAIVDLLLAYDNALLHFEEVSPAAQRDLWENFKGAREQALQFLSQLDEELFNNEPG